MRSQRKISGWMLFFVILGNIFFYLILFSLSKWFPALTGRTLKNEWALILISSIPLIVTITVFFSTQVTKAKIGDYELEFDKAIPKSLIDAEKVKLELLTSNLSKQGEIDLPNILDEVKNLNYQPKILLVSLDELGNKIRFQVLREYIYKLSKYSRIEYVVFLNENDKYIGFLTVEDFKAKFPLFGLEVIVEDLRDEKLSNKMLEANLAMMPNIEEKRKYLQRVNFLIRSQWAHNKNNQGVRVFDLPKLGAREFGVSISTSLKDVYALLVKEDLRGVPVIDNDESFIGIASQEKIANTLILNILENLESRES